MSGKPKAIIFNANGANKWQTAFDAVSEGVCLLDLEGRVEQCNTALANLLNKSPCDIIGSTWFELARGIPDYINQCPFLRMRRTLHREVLDIRMGDRYFHVIAVPALSQAGTLAGAVVVVADISELKRAEETLRTCQAQLASVIGSAMYAIISIDAEQRIILFNAAAEAMFRCSCAEAIGQPIDRFIQKGSRRKHRKHVREFGITNVTNRPMNPLGNIIALRADGEEFPIEASISQIETAGQKLQTVILRDISQRLQAHKAIRESEEWFREIFEGSRDAIFLVLPSGRFMEVNQAACDLTGYSREELLSTSMPDLHEEEDPQGFRDHVDSVMSGVDMTFEVLMRRKGGVKVPVELSDRKMMFRGKQVMHTTARDITERKRSQELYRMLVDAIPSSVLLIGKNLQIMLANKNFLEKACLSKSEIIGRRITEILPTVILDEMDLEERIRQVFRGESAMQGQQLTYRAPGVPQRFYYYNIIPVTWGLEVENAMLLMNDVTEQIRLGEEIRRMERHLASVVESASDIILSTDAQGRILTWNKAAEMISGYFFDEVKGRIFYEYCAGDHHEKVKAIFSNVQDQTRSHMAELHMAAKEGGLIPVSWGFYPMRNDVDQVVGLVGVGRDLTERRKFEMQILQSQKLAALGVMAGGIAHEIRNPLAIASSAAQFLMEDDITSEFQKECAQEVYAGIQRASVIIENLLRFAHPSARADARADMEGVDLLSVLTECLTLIGRQAKIQRIELRPDFPEGLVLILGLAGLLERAFMNLLLNALQAMLNGGTLSIAVRTADGQVLVCITDTGHGIPNADIGKIFDPFYTTSPVGKGTGLGLSICYSIIKEHFGSIEVDSAEGEGTRFTVRLPLF